MRERRIEEARKAAMIGLKDLPQPSSKPERSAKRAAPVKKKKAKKRGRR